MRELRPPRDANSPVTVTLFGRHAFTMSRRKQFTTFS
jgi:hypothetical protein